MSCRNARRLLSDYLAGVLAPHRAAAVAAHLTTCPGCAAELARLVALGALLDEDRVPVIEDVRWQTFLPAVRARLAATRPRPRPAFWLVPALAAASLLVALVGYRFVAPHPSAAPSPVAAVETSPVDSLVALAASEDSGATVRALTVQRLVSVEQAAGLEASLDGESAFETLLEQLNPAERTQLIRRLAKLMPATKEV